MVPARTTLLRLERFPPHAWGVIAVIALSILYGAIQVALVRPFLWPAGAGAIVSSDQLTTAPLIARPPAIDDRSGGGATVTAVAHGSPAAQAGVVPGCILLSIRRDDGSLIARNAPGSDAAERLDGWRAMYWSGVSGPVIWTILAPDAARRDVRLNRPAVWRSGARGWARIHLGMVLQIVVFTAGAVVLLFLRPGDATAGLAALALALSAMGSGGPLLGAERILPLGGVLTVFSWIATPLAFPVIALAILYFPTPSPLLARFRWLSAAPFIAVAPMLLPSLMTSLYLVGIDATRRLAVWDASHPGIYYGSFAAALALNVLAIGEGVYRYRFNHDANERRRIRMAVYTAAPGVLAYAIKDGVPVVMILAGLSPPQYPIAVVAVLQVLVLLPVLGLAYAIGVARVLGPGLVLRRSLQYALASRTLSILTLLPIAALMLSLVRDREKTLGQIVTGSAGLYLVLIAVSAGALAYRDRVRQWLDLRFFREEYDARKVLLSLASRVRHETEPGDLAEMVVNQLDEALHPEMVAILASGVEEGRLTPVMVLHGSAESLPLDGGLVSMLRWSDEPLEIYRRDPRSPARRLPREEQEWLECTGAVLFVPVLARDRSLTAVIALGERRSEDAYTIEDRQLLASIATQMGLGFDVARLRRDAELRSRAGRDTTHAASALEASMTECTQCGRCDDAGTAMCPADGSPMKPVAGVPRTVERKYRIEHLLGRGGMGAVYRARDVRLDRLVALKVVRAEFVGDLEAGRRFRREAQIVARLQHPSIVTVFDYGVFADGGAYLVMELVRGEDLRKVLQREGRLDPARAMRILSPVCSGIEAAHREGVLHRDLKPENILLPGGGLDAKVLDFGVAKVIAEERQGGRIAPPDVPTTLTAAGTIVGTPAYMAPEQFNAAPADARTDVFSLGVIAYEMLTGDLPFGRGSLAEIVLAQARGMPPMPAAAASPAVERAIRSALDADPDRRPASAQAFAHLLAAAVGM
jgi:hypothetical protein